MGFYRKKEKNTRKTWKIKTGITVAIIAILSVTISTSIIINTANADSGIAEAISAKARQNGLKKCINGINLKSGPFSTSGQDIGGVSTDKYKNIDSILTKEASDDRVLVPTKYGNTDKDGIISCKQLFKGGSGISGAYPTPKDGDGLDKIDSFLTSVGYKAEDVTADGDEWSCYEFSYKVNHANGGNTTITEYSRPLCVRTNNGKVAAQDGKTFSAPVDSVYRTDGKSAGNQKGDVVTLGAHTSCFLGCSTKITVWFTPTNVTGAVSVSQGNVSIAMGDDWSSIVSKLDAIAQRVKTYIGDASATLPGVYLVQEDEVSYGEANTWSYPAEGSATAKKYTYGGGDAKNALKFLTGLDDFVPYTETERNWMYYTYFSDSKYFNALSVDGECTSTKPAGSYLQYYDSGKDEYSYCPISSSTMTTARTKSKVNAITAVGSFDLAETGVDNILAGLNSIDLKSYCAQDSSYPLCKATPKDCETDPSLPGCTPAPGPNPGGGEVDDEPSDEEICYAKARSLGWVICPIIYGLHEATEDIYQAVVPFIQTNQAIVAELGKNDSSQGLYKAWSIFRGFANVVFAILFMLVIFSQLTGFGIDNYGIKRMLPKLIITAILVNLSYWICGIAVDISNIVGSSVKDILERIGNSIYGDFGGVPSSLGVMGQKLMALLAVGGPIAIIGTISFALEGWAIIIPILLFFLVVIISVFFAFILLGMRQALVVILIVLAPLALACSLLPNTEGIYKKWLGALKGVLMVYPIVGAVIGAGYLAACILMNADGGFLMTLISGILMVGPFFLIPSITSNALDAVGHLGSRLSNFGRNTGNRIRGGISNSEAARNARADSREAMADWRANRFLDSRLGRSTERRLRNGETVSTRRARRYARAQERAQGRNKANLAAYDSMLSSRETHDRLNRMQTGGLEAREFAQSMNAREAELSDQRLATDDGRAAWQASVDDKALEAAISDQSKLMERDGTFGSDERFRSEVRNAALGNDDASRAKLEALMRKAANGSDRQRELLREGMNDAFSTGNVRADQAARYGAHVTGNSIYKKNDRSMHDQATAIMNAVGNDTYGTQGTRADGSQYDHRVQSLANDNFVGQGFVKGKQSAESAFNYDDGEFAALVRRMQSINQELNNSATTDSRRAELENIKENIAKTLGEGIYIKENDPNNKYGNVNKHVIDEMKRVINTGYGNDGWKKFYQSDSAAFKVPREQTQIVTQNVESEFREMGGSNNLPNPPIGRA